MKGQKRARKPTSVGEMLREEFLKPMNLTQRALAEHLEMETKAINKLVNEKTGVTPIMALKLAKAFGTSAEFWLNLQMANDLWELEKSDIKMPKKLIA